MNDPDVYTEVHTSAMLVQQFITIYSFKTMNWLVLMFIHVTSSHVRHVW
jgi:hypothetical protein